MQNQMTREQAVLQFGEDAVIAVESTNCEPTGRIGYNGRSHGDALIEWSATVGHLTAVYYTDEADEDLVERTDDWSNVDWQIHHYASDAYRAAVWVSDDQQAEVRLTGEDQANLTDAELLSAAKAEAALIDLNLAGGEIRIGLVD